MIVNVIIYVGWAHFLKILKYLFSFFLKFLPHPLSAGEELNFKRGDQEKNECLLDFVKWIMALRGQFSNINLGLFKPNKIAKIENISGLGFARGSSTQADTMDTMYHKYSQSRTERECCIAIFEVIYMKNNYLYLKTLFWSYPFLTVWDFLLLIENKVYVVLSSSKWMTSLLTSNQ